MSDTNLTDGRYCHECACYEKQERKLRTQLAEARERIATLAAIAEYAKEYLKDELDHFPGDEDCDHCHLTALFAKLEKETP